MKRDILLYGFIGGLLITVLKWTEYRFLVLEHSGEIYGALIAVVFAVLGLWLGMRFRRGHTDARVVPPPVPAEVKRPDFGMTRRELEILELIAQGMSNQEIADKLFVSPNTVKTHASRVFEKLGAKRRTQAVQLGKEFGLLR
jgi:DNA-binding CsgD family transcriptional regulator